MRKLAIAGVSVALMLAVAVPAFAATSVYNTNVKGSNKVLTVSNTGFNATTFGGNIKTGKALAVTAAGNVVGTTVVDSTRGGVTVQNNYVKGSNEVATVANTGVNYASGGSIRTGNAAAGSLLVNVVGTTIVGK